MTAEQNGFGANLSLLSGYDEEGVKAYKDAIGKVIAYVVVDTKADPNHIRFVFTDHTGLDLYDDAQSCCESRYLHTDDTLDYYKDSILQGVNLKDGPDIGDEDNSHEQTFLEIVTSKGSFTVVSHNEHNGYYGGIIIKPRPFTPMEAVTEQPKQRSKRNAKK